MDFLIAAALVMFCMFANRLRGGGFKPALAFVPSVAIYGTYGLIAWLLSGAWVLGVIVFVGSLIQWTPGWGAWYDLGRGGNMAYGTPWGPDDPRWDSPYVKVMSWLGQYNDHFTFFIRHMFVAPMIAVAVWWFSAPAIMLIAIPLFALCVVIIYELAWLIFRGEEPIAKAEWAAGLPWAIVLALLISMV